MIAAEQKDGTKKEEDAYWMNSSRGLDASEVANIGSSAIVRARYWAVDAASVPVAERGVSGELSLVGAATITVRVEVLMRPERPVTT
jgi:hypothetical protein